MEGRRCSSGSDVNGCRRECRTVQETGKGYQEGKGRSSCCAVLGSSRATSADDERRKTSDAGHCSLSHSHLLPFPVPVYTHTQVCLQSPSLYSHSTTPSKGRHWTCL